MNERQSGLVAWLNDLIGEELKYPSNVAFADHVGISEGTVRRMLAGEIPTLRTLRKIAAAEPGVSLEELQRLAGILPQKPDPEKERLLRELENVVSRLPEKDQKFILDMALRMLEGQ